MTTDLNTQIREGFDELETEIQAREAQRGGNAETAAAQAEDDAIQSGAIALGAALANAAIWKATSNMGTALTDDALKAMGGMKLGNGKLWIDLGNKMAARSVPVADALAKIAKAEGLVFYIVHFNTEEGIPIKVFEIENTEKGRAFLKKYIKPDGTGLTELARAELTRISGARSTGGRAGAGAALSDDALRVMGGMKIEDGKIRVGDHLGRNAQENVRDLFKLARAKGITGVRKVRYMTNNPGSYRLDLPDTPEARAFLQRYVELNGTGLTELAEQELASINAGGRSAGQRAGADASRPQGRSGATPEVEAARPQGRSAGAGAEAPRPSGQSSPTAQARSGLSGIKGSAIKWGARGLGIGFGAWAAVNFISDLNNLGEAGANAAGADGVSVQAPMPEQYRGEVSPADQKYFTKDSPEEKKFRAMVFYAAMQEGGFMGMTQEEWQEYAVRLSQAEGGIISPQAELKIRKALVQAYPEYQQAIQDLSNREVEQQPDATRGIRSGGAEPLDEGQAGPTPSNRGRGNQSSGRTGF